MDVAAAAAGLGVALGLLVWCLRRRAARRGEYPRTLVYDPEAGGWVAARRRGPRIGS